MELKLQDGSFRLSIAGIEKTFFAQVESQPVSSAACSHFESFASTVPVVAGSPVCLAIVSDLVVNYLLKNRFQL
jgi:hypothetical protein